MVWANGDFTVPDNERIYNDETARPFVDDFFRADNRWGPKPRYDGRTDDFDVTQQPETIGDPITGAVQTSLAGPDGFDGYWERQSVTKGMRIIVGQRLELGNANGWNYDPSGVADDANVNGLGDPLYPPKALHADLNNINTADTVRTDLNDDAAAARVGGNHQYLQRRSLRDNLAAVQGMVVYHYEGPGSMADDGTFPAACMALTAHPGTQQSIYNSRTFDAYPSATGPVKADFLHGYGTNGWEFQYPSAFNSASTFESEYEATTETPLKKALKNLAYFAGDPDGGAPSFKPVPDSSFVHPFPYMAMWGDFSPLRRIVVEGDGGTTTYDSLSPADQSTLHSAACTLSLLAYNLDKLDDEYTAITPAEWTTDTEDVDGNAVADGISDSGLAKLLLDRVGTGANQIPVESLDEVPIDVWVNNIKTANTLTEADADIKRIRLAADYWQVLRDRTFGFASAPGLSAVTTSPIPLAALGTYAQATGTFDVTATDSTYPVGTYSVKCDPNEFASLSANADEALTLALALCPNENTITTPGQAQNTVKAVKYPSLYYLFPLADHGQKAAATTPPTGVPTIDQPEDEEYIDATADGTLDNITTYTVNGTAEVYQIVDPADLAADPATAATDAAWTLPISAATTAYNPPTATSPTDPDDVPFTINYKGTSHDVPLLDKALYDGRELLNVRVLDIDIAKLTGNDAVSDKWLSSDLENQAEGIVYAYREDAVREDEIVRPQNASATPAACQTIDRGEHPRLFAIERDATCYMQAEPINAVGTTVYGDDVYTAQDPPLTDELISFKPVDFIPDPERRPHGFRLRTGDGTAADFSNGGREVGMTFVTDNSVYILGNFNRHVKVEVADDDTTTTDELEEFTDTILEDGFTFDEFYEGRTNEELDLDNFANLAVDHWRPVELLSDSITILSSNFEDGAVSDTFTEAQGSTVPTSYTNQPRPLHAGLAATDWIQENRADANSPIWIDRNGTYYRPQTGPTGALWPARPFYQFYNADNQWRDLDENIGIQPAVETYVNATFVSGIVPTRPGQAYGGLHNYTRFLENWGAGDARQGLYIQGSFIQLDFSTGSTAPQDQDAWEPGDEPILGDDAAEVIRYYDAPLRFFGYDVALLYVPPAPAAARFVTIGSPRSEYYREVAADDPYVELLKCALDSDGDKVLPSLCPG